jgi:DNA-binding CsgD family transcriptional regulator/PAS domain-containing protein
MQTLERAQPLIEALYEGAIEPSRWQDFVEILSDTMGGAASCLSIQLPGAIPGRQAFRTGFDDRYWPRLEGHLKRGLPWGSLESSPFRKRFGRASERLPDELMRESDFYKEFMQPQGLAPEAPLFHLLSLSDHWMPSGVMIYRRESGRPFETADFDFVNLLVPHLGRAFRIAMHQGGVQRTGIALREVIDRLPMGVVLLDEDRQVVIANRQAQRILDKRDGLKIGKCGLEASHSGQNRELRSLVSGAIAAEQDALVPDTFLMVSRKSGKRAYPVMVSPLLEAPPDAASRDAAVAVFITDPEERHFSTAEILQTLYGLSPAEAELVQLLTQGLSLELAARERCVSIHTVRSQLKSVFAKTHTTGQSDLVQMVLTGVAAIGEE